MMDEIIRVRDQFYILATSSLADDRTRVLKHDDMFAVFDRYGDIQPIGLGEQGIYYEGTRFLSRLELGLGESRPLLLGSTVNDDNSLLAVDLTNPDIYIGGNVIIPRGTLHIFRSKFLWHGVCYERLRIINHGLSPVEVVFSLGFEADFRDIFEVRGIKREHRGQRLKDTIEEKGVVLQYKGLDNVIRQTRLEFSPALKEVSASQIRFDVCLGPKEEAMFFLTVTCELEHKISRCFSYDCAFGELENKLKIARAQQDCEIYTSNEQFNNWLNRSLSDLYMMVTDTPEGPYPYAGVPWFSTPFGRDGIITALEFLLIDSNIARGVLTYLASTQARETIPERDAEPGKILHEARSGEMAALGEVPFSRYYGSVDATPLFIILAGAYYERTGDRRFIESIWPNIELALNWIDSYGDIDGDGFVEYFRRSSRGLVHQGWKDSQDSIFHADGILAEGPIALCEVQGYVYDAKLKASELASVLGYVERANELIDQANRIKERFEEVFWCDEISTYARALDGKKRLCRVRTSNAGHCLFSGIASQDRAERMAQALLGEDFFSGWGIRTVAASEIRYNPMSYHNGSIWPFDNAIITAGLSRYGFKDLAIKVLTGLFDAVLFFDLYRLPELFCGFRRRPGSGPTLYPLSCAPQSWSAASVFFLIQSCLGLHISVPSKQIYFSHPLLPDFLHRVWIKNLKVGGASGELLIERHTQGVDINIIRKEGPDIDIVIIR
jgi:glycogen debranching enzyme